ncbi:helix-turn-helix transcriptional regulator [Candidatus Saccharibacteria bacterium]|nr:helix-turn-helix transcriptional regulator [Candidatus Saccharibacteria bacterium]
MPRVRQTEEDKAIIKIVSDNVKFYRLNHNCTAAETDKYGRISQEKLAELSDTSASMISNIEAANVNATMSIAFLRKIAVALRVPLYAFFLEHPVKNPPVDPFEKLQEN